MADKLHSVLKSALFWDAVYAVVKHDASHEVCCKIDSFYTQDHVEVYEMNPLNVQLLFASDANNAIATVSMPIFIDVNGTSCTIYLKAKVSSYEQHKVHA